MSAPSWRGLRRWGRRSRPLAALLTGWPAALAALAACSGGWHVGSNSQVTDPATVDYPVFYVKRQVPVDQAGLLVVRPSLDTRNASGTDVGLHSFDGEVMALTPTVIRLHRGAVSQPMVRPRLEPP